jgi:putative tryptophan/tyrosine transport system substrate-binding protein
MGAGPVKIGALNESWGPVPQIGGLRDGLVALGYRENEHFVIGIRFTQGDVGALAPAARELVQQGADLLFPVAGDAVEAARQATSTLPIVFAGAGDDPVSRGVVKSFARPGGNVTGVVDLGVELAAKRLELFRDLVPGLKRVLVPYAANARYAAHEAQAYRDASRQLGITLLERPVTSQQEAQALLAQVRKSEIQGILLPHSVIWNIPGLALDAATAHNLPTMFPESFFVHGGGLAGYGPDYYETGRQAARLVDKILKGQKPADIPVESNGLIEFTLNLKVARRLGLTIPPSIQARANRVIE